MKESLKTKVNFDDLNGIWLLFPETLLKSIALMHSFNANRLLLISAPSTLLCFSSVNVSWALSDPARSTSINFPILFSFLDSFIRIFGF
jgi:hypothetical protein